MKNAKLIGTLLILLQAVNGYCQITDWIWAKSLHTTGGSTGQGVCVDRQNNAFFIGSFNGTLSFDSINLTSNGSSDVYLAKYDVSGNTLWAVSGGGSSSDYIRAVSVDRDGNAYIIGNYMGSATFSGKTITSVGGSDIYIAKYSSSGELVWLKSIGGANYDDGFGISADSMNNLVIGGVYVWTINIDGHVFSSTANSTLFVVSFDTAGTFQWEFQPTNGRYQSIAALQTDYSGEIYVTGQFIDTLEFDSIDLISGGQTDVFLLKICSSGKLHWARSGKGTKQGYSNGMCINENGDVYITGTFNGIINFGNKTLTSANNDYVDIFLVRYDWEGEVSWATKAGGNSYDQGWSVCVDKQNNTYVTGFFNLTASFGSNSITSNGGNDLFVAKFNSNGINEWAKGVGGMDYDMGYGIAIGSNNKIYMTGFFEGTVQFGSIILTGNTTSTNIFVAQLGVPPPPSIVIISQPVGDEVCYGDQVSFEVGAIGKDIKYQWKRDNHIIPGADSSVYNITSANFTNAGTYKCELSDLTYSVTTNNVILTVDSTPVIITHPQSITKKVGQIASFSVNATDENCQWFKNDVPINNATQITYTIPVVKYSDSGNYKCAVYNNCGDVVSNVAKLTVTSSTDISDRLTESGLSIYPNPASDILFVNFLQEMSHIKIQIINTNGEILLEQLFSNGNMMKVDVSKFNKGLYFLKVSYGSNIRLEKIMIR